LFEPTAVNAGPVVSCTASVIPVAANTNPFAPVGVQPPAFWQEAWNPK
jgi:hypothetical protein